MTKSATRFLSSTGILLSNPFLTRRYSSYFWVIKHSLMTSMRADAESHMVLRATWSQHYQFSLYSKYWILLDIVITVRSLILVDSHLNVFPLLLHKVHLHYTQLTRTLSKLKARGEQSRTAERRWVSSDAKRPPDLLEARQEQRQWRQIRAPLAL